MNSVPGAMLPISVVILTFNSADTIGATVASARALSDDVHVVDSDSTDATLDIVRAAGASVASHPFESYGAQRNWAIATLALRHPWQLHLDADERVTDELAAELRALFAGDGPPAAIAGYYVPRLVHFHGQPIRHGGMWPIHHMRLFRSGRGRCEDRKYDQHFYVDGATATLRAPMIDDIRLSLGEWTARHNRWADAEVDEILAPSGSGVIQPGSGDPVAEKRALRSRYNRAPLFWRALGLFLYRYVLRLGFLDGRWGLVFFVLQTFWFRFLVDAKLHERRAREARR
ncbi:MAG: glycosyltransferase family 2 protein [Alphaproteobacteria bacterium]